MMQSKRTFSPSHAPMQSKTVAFVPNPKRFAKRL